MQIRTPRAWSHAASGTLADWLSLAVRSSWIYRWLTTEPEPEVIVIDLRETVTAGSIISAIDRLLRLFLPATAHSALCRRLDDRLRRLRTAPIREISVYGIVVMSGAILLAGVTGRLTPAVLAALGVGVGLMALGTRVHRSWAELRETRMGRVVRSTFEPPERP